MLKTLAPTIRRFLPDWNNRVHTEADGYEFCERFDVATLDTDLIRDLGEYRIRNGSPIILLHKFTSNRYRNVVFQHEIGHFILHPTTAAKYSDEVTKRKIEKEANFVAAVAVLPRYVIDTKTLAEIADEFNVPRKVILFRKLIRDTEGI